MDTSQQTGSTTVSTLRPWRDSALPQGFFSREGGVSRGPYATLNLGTHVGDDPVAVEENWRRVRAATGIETLARLVQVHGRTVHVVSRANASNCPEGDGMVTVERGIALAVLTADCVPILIADESRGVVAAVHGGWRGVIAGIVGEALSQMAKLGARPGHVRAALGPSIGLCCFEVDRELADRFAREIPASAAHSRAGRPGKAYLDLRGIVRDQLIEAGLAAHSIASVGPCTQCESARYFSRRAAGGAITGLQMSYIALPMENR